MTNDTPAPNWRKFASSALVGAAVGAGGMIGLVTLHERGTFGELDASGMIACITGLVFVLIGAQVVLGIAWPGLGRKFLNVEDAEELLEQRRVLGYAAAAMLAWGAILIVVALGGPGGTVAPAAALTVALCLVAGCVLLSVLMWRHMDELMRDMSRQCGNLSFYLLLAVGGLWATLAQLGYAAAPAPLDWLTMFTALTLLASFVAVGLRGMLVPR